VCLHSGISRKLPNAILHRPLRTTGGRARARGHARGGPVACARAGPHTFGRVASLASWERQERCGQIEACSSFFFFLLRTNQSALPRTRGRCTTSLFQGQRRGRREATGRRAPWTCGRWWARTGRRLHAGLAARRRSRRSPSHARPCPTTTRCTMRTRSRRSPAARRRTGRGARGCGTSRRSGRPR